MSKLDDKLKKFLEKVRSKENINSTFPNNNERNEMLEIARIAEDEKFIKHSSSSNQPMIITFMNSEWMLAPSTQLTRAGHQFLEGFDRNMSQPSQTFNVGTAYGSAFGNENEIHNTYSNTPIEELKTFVDKLENKDDQRIGNDLIETLQNEPPRPGFLSKFKSFIDRYPKVIDSISSFLVSIAVSAMKEI